MGPMVECMVFAIPEEVDDEMVKAMEQRSLATLLFPCAVSGASLVAIVMIVTRRRAIPARPAH